MSWMEAMQALHFIRPGWLWGLLALPLLAAVWRRRRRRADAWRGAVDPHLLPHLLEGHAGSRGYAGLLAMMLAAALAILALAGPSWRQVEQPLWQSRTPLVIALDLSSAALAGDLPPSRLAQARAKLQTLLHEREGGQVGLVVYADDAYTVSPLTADAGNVALFLDALHPDVMPIDGQRADRAIEWSARLLEQAGFDEGRILLMAGDVGADAAAAAATARASGYRVSVLGLGTETGAPYRRRDGRLAQAALDPDALRGLAAAGGGGYATLTTDAGDLRALGVLDPAGGDGRAGADTARVWQDGGYWLLPPLMLLALFAFRRRGGALAVLLLCAWLPWQPARAVEWWQRPEQVAHEHMERGTRAYREGDYPRAARQYRQVDSADGFYNLGNALAKAGDYPGAIAAYEQALELQPGMPDAIANKRAVEQAMKRPPPGGGGGQQSRPDPGGQEQQPGDGAPSPPDGQQGDSGQDGQAAAGQPPPASSAGGQPRAEEPPGTPGPADARAQADADRAQRERMQRALQQAQDAPRRSGQPAAGSGETPRQREQRLANEAWLNRVPDDPGGLLREKFRLEHQRRRGEDAWGE